MRYHGYKYLFVQGTLKHCILLLNELSGDILKMNYELAIDADLIFDRDLNDPDMPLIVVSLPAHLPTHELARFVLF